MCRYEESKQTVNKIPGVGALVPWSAGGPPKGGFEKVYSLAPAMHRKWILEINIPTSVESLFLQHTSSHLLVHGDTDTQF